MLLVLVVASVTGLGALVWLWPRCSGAACPSVAALRDYSPPQASRIFDREGQLVAHLAPERRILVSLGELPPHLIGAFLAVEDKRFYRHHGVDYRRVAGALARNLRTLRYGQGFSTITMQLARNVFPEHLSREKTLARKLWEVMLARDIERAFSKDEILEMYLNQIYLGEGFYGVEAAARGYFGKPASEVLQSEAALLAALPRAPSYYNPRRNPPAALGRRNLVLGLMAAEKVISPELAERARAAPLRLAPPPEALGRAPYFVAAVRRELTERFGVDADRAGLRVYTTLDPGMQAAAERELVARIRAVEAGQFGPFRGKSCASGEAAAPSACLQGLFVAMSTRTGDVLALVGGRDFTLSQFDRATQAKRQAGSAFKPVVYATALAEGIPISTALVGPGATFASYPAGYNPADHVSDTLTLDMRGALRLSSNRAAVSLGERVGVSRVVQTARDLGITTPIGAYPSTFLGAAEVIPLEMVAAFTAFAADGVRATPRLIRNVEDGRGRTIWEAPIERHRALSPGVAYLTTTLMEEVVDRGTGSGVRSAGLPWDIPAAGKTGTTDDAADVWFVGVTPDVAAGVWMGFDRPRRILRNASGGGLAAPVWGEVMKDYYRSRPPPMRWTPPAELVRVEIDQRSGMLATRACPPDEVVAEWYLPGTEPLEYCPLHPDDFGGWLDRMTRGLSGWFGGKDTRP
ncbi:MAG: PBP1A family penicillin-binding protein [Gemmatimonadota bacterium]|nr:PBP1A family penicillin-binding protein [Gemmatimonadota bacterium]